MSFSCSMLSLCICFGNLLIYLNMYFCDRILLACGVIVWNSNVALESNDMAKNTDLPSTFPYTCA